MEQHPAINRFVTTFVGTATLIAAVALLVALSYEILWGNHARFSQGYMNLQLAVCAIFLLDFAVRISAEERKWHFLQRNVLFLLLSVPYLNIVEWLGVPPPREWSIVLTTIPILRMLLAVYLVAQWVVKDGIKRLFAAYAFTLLLFTYLSALIFYDFEQRTAQLRRCALVGIYEYDNRRLCGDTHYRHRQDTRGTVATTRNVGVTSLYGLYLQYIYDSKKERCLNPSIALFWEIVSDYFFSLSRSRISVSRTSSFEGAGSGAGAAGFASSFFINLFIILTIRKTQKAKITKSIHC